MASVYSNSYCTVAASASADGTGGCSLNPDSQPYGPVTLDFNEADEEGNNTHQKIRVYSVFGKPNVNVLTQDPLTKRGWAFQERELSTRILHYSHDTIRWECRSLKASLLFPWGDTNAFNGAMRTFDAGPNALPMFGSPYPTRNPTASEQQRNQDIWFQAVDKYTDRALTKQSDKLPSLSGLARAVQARDPRNRYLAGLWSDNLVASLLWYSAWHPAGGQPVFHPESPAPIFHRRQEEYIAPSWSWAAIVGHVRYETWIFTALDPDPLAGPNAAYVARVLEAETVPSGRDTFGELKSGFVRLQGKIKPAVTQGEGFKRQDREGIYDMHEGKLREVGMIKFDVPADSPEGRLKIIVCLCLMPRAERFGDTVGLALVPTGGKDEFRRVGLILLTKLSWWEGSIEAPITLV
jgi:hypothetical protein